MNVSLCIVLIMTISGCGSSVDYKEGIKGSWRLYHYYENAENGVDVFLDNTNYWTVEVTDGSFSITSMDDKALNIDGGTYQWSKADEAEVMYDDGTRCTMRISANSKKHNELAEWDIYVVETNMYYVLETPEGE